MIFANLFLIRADLILELSDRLPRARQRIRLAIETFVTMTTHAAAFREQVAPKVQHFCALGHTIARVTLLASGLSVLFLKHGPQPEAMAAVSLRDVSGRAAITPVTTRTTELLRTVNLKDLAVRMADKSTRPTVRLFTWSIRRHVRGLYIEWLSYSGVAHLAAVDNVVSSDADLVTKDRIVVTRDLVLYAFDLQWDLIR